VFGIRWPSVDPHRNLPDDAEARWFPGDRGYPDQERDRRGSGDGRYVSPLDAPGDDRYPDVDRFRVPEPRSAQTSLSDFDNLETGLGSSRYEPADRELSGRYNPVGPVGPRSGEALPPRPGLRPSGDRPPLGDRPLGSLGDRPPGPVGDRFGGERPMDEPSVRHSTEPIDRTAVRRPVGGPPPLAGPPQPISPQPADPQHTGPLPLVGPPPGAGGVTYRSRWPGLTALLIVLGVVFEVPAVRIFALGFTRTSPSSMIAGSFMILGVPLFACGLYALLTGGAVTPGQPAARVWLRGTLAALPVGLILFIAAALAVGPN
jgi:hypothetical protein